MSKITKAVIPAAGFGTRFLPQTKALPKEMMPLVDKPIIQRVVEELVEAGIETIIMVTSWQKRAIEDHFDHQFELENLLEKTGKTEELRLVQKISEMAEFIYIRQKGMLGNATPILNAKHIIGNDPFVVLWGDEFIDAEPNRTSQLIAAYEKYHSLIVPGLKATSDYWYKRYGIVGGEKVENGTYKISKIVEKPGDNREGLSDLAAIGGFVGTPDIFEALEEAKAEVKEGQELVYTLGIQKMIDKGIPVYAQEIQNAQYRDTGNKLEYLKTVVEYGLKHEDIGADFAKFIKDLKI
ncbi:MAG: sugar phosphate nucleotidyltransferase [Patescibacteria group bacterium]|nr:sugar phosphate nucleotidyltransferase [Patescibacteria group bacterium]